MKTQTETDVQTETALRKKVESEFASLCNRTNQGPSTTFDDLLEFIVKGFEIGGEGLKGWKYTKEQTDAFRSMFRTLVSSMDEILKTRDWYDFLGGIYEMQVAGKGRKSSAGQFFTPMNVCELMAALTGPSEAEEPAVTDPCCGSGRLLLAAHAQNPGARVYAQDIDRTCCLMAAVNLMMHGCVGSVTHGDSMKQEVWEVWSINPWIAINGSPVRGIPHIVKEHKKSA